MKVAESKVVCCDFMAKLGRLTIKFHRFCRIARDAFTEIVADTEVKQRSIMSFGGSPPPIRNCQAPTVSRSSASEREPVSQAEQRIGVARFRAGF